MNIVLTNTRYFKSKIKWEMENSSRSHGDNLLLNDTKMIIHGLYNLI